MVKKFIFILMLILSIFSVNSAINENLFRNSVEFYWDLDSNPNLDLSPNLNNPIIVNGIITNGKLNNGIQLDNTVPLPSILNSYITSTNNVNILGNSGGMSVSFWANLNSVDPVNILWLFGIVSNSGNYPMAVVLAPGNNIQIFEHDGVQSNSGLINLNTINNGNYDFYVFVRDRDNQYHAVYENGVLIANVSVVSRNPSSSNTFTLNGFLPDGGYANSGVNKFDEVILFSKSLTQDEVNFIYNNNNPTNSQKYPFFFNPIQMIVNTPNDLTNYTFDVVNVPIDVNTAIATNCSVTNSFDNITQLFTTTGGLSHQTNLVLPNAINQSQTFNVDVTCNDIINTQSTILTLFKQRIPLSLDIIVPKANQIFNVDTGQIEFFLETNYQTDCSYQRDTEFIRTSFTSTGGAFHKTNFTTDLNVSTYNMNFLCIGNIINENASKNITFFLDELTKFSLTRTTTQLPQVGEDIGGFFGNLAPSVVEFMLNFAIITLIVSMVVVPIIFIRKFGK